MVSIAISWSPPVKDVPFDLHAGDTTADPTNRQYNHPYPTPGEVLAEIAGVIAICLGLALLAQLLIPPPPGL